MFPGCQARGFLEVHHLDHWADGGATDLDRLVCLCPFHHDAHHRGEFTITGRPTPPQQLVRPTSGARAGLVFTTARGRIIGPDAAQAVVEGVGPREHVGDAYRGPTGEAYRGPTGEAYRGPTGERLYARWLDLPANRSPRRPGLTVVPNVGEVADGRPEPARRSVTRPEFRQGHPAGDDMYQDRTPRPS